MIKKEKKGIKINAYIGVCLIKSIEGKAEVRETCHTLKLPQEGDPRHGNGCQTS